MDSMRTSPTTVAICSSSYTMLTFVYKSIVFANYCNLLLDTINISLSLMNLFYNEYNFKN